MSNYHTAVLLKESVEALVSDKNGVYVDATFGGGGHSSEILNNIEKGKLFAFDQDPDAAENEINDSRFTLIPNNFQFITNYLKMHKAIPVRGVLADLGVSSHQFNSEQRGFSFRFDGPLDMRMDRNADIPTAADIVNTYSREALAKVFREYGEIKQAYKLAIKIENYRLQNPFNEIAQLKEVALQCIAPREKQNQFLAQVFQALRIEVNKELDALKKMLLQCENIIEKGGRLVVISYHSLEDRLVKNYIRSGNFEGKVHKDFYGNPLSPFKKVGTKAQVPSEAEIAENPRARSAKMRIAERV